ncbi:MAG: diacylglycerol kinase family protein [Terracidiphilus sp.]|jgi:YegS/Rv2252/BmrU family lipid kinase
MRRVALIYNPASGQHTLGRRQAIDKALVILREAGVEAEALETSAPGSASLLTVEAISRGCDAILACGGDGTVHEVLQSLVGTNIALGVVPLGTANALAANLGLHSSPAKTVRKLLAADPVRISVGQISYRAKKGATDSHYFTVAAGVGADALFLSRLDPSLKRRLGYLLYLVEGFRVWATYSFPLFEAAFVERFSAQPRVEQISQLLAVRIRDFGGVLHNFAPGATLHNNDLRLIAFKTRSRLSYFRFLLATIFGHQTFSSEIELLDAVSVECRPSNGSPMRVFAEADGELLGRLPVRIEIVPDAVTLLIPLGARP